MNITREQIDKEWKKFENEWELKQCDDWLYEAGLLAMCWVDDVGEWTNPKDILPDWIRDSLNRKILEKVVKFREDKNVFDPLMGKEYFGLEEVKRLMSGFSTYKNICTQYPEHMKYFKLRHQKSMLEKLSKEGNTDKCLEIAKEIEQTRKPKDTIYESSMSQIAKETMEELTDGVDGKIEKYYTGISKLDYKLGSLRPKRFYIIGGKPGTCKTNLALKIMLGLMKKSVPAVFFSCEMGRTDLFKRMACMEMPDNGISYSKVVEDRMTREELAIFQEVSSELYKLQGMCFETGRFSLKDVYERIDKIDAKIVIIDFLQMFRLKEIDEESRAAQMSEVASSLKELAMDKNIIVIGLSQLNALGELKESGGLNEKADAVITLSAEPDEDIEKIIRASITKNRFGDTGTIKLKLDKRTLNMDTFEPKI